MGITWRGLPKLAFQQGKYFVTNPLKIVCHASFSGPNREFTV
jgi:hypothetical protein